MPEVKIHKALADARIYINERRYDKPYANEYIRPGLNSNLIHVKLLALEWKTSPPIIVNTPTMREMFINGDEETVRLANAIINQKLKENEHSIKSR